MTLLGLLEREPSHGYDLKRDYDAYFGRGKPLPVGQVYATLAHAAATAGGETRRSHILEEGWEKALGPDRPGEHPVDPRPERRRFGSFSP